MPDSLKRRGKHPRDETSFHPDRVPDLLAASRDLAWLKTRGYADSSSLKLVGDRYKLDARQRTAVARSTCSDSELQNRSQRLVQHTDIKGKQLYIDGFNLLTSIEAALGNGILLIGRDGCLRDMSSMHGNYRVLDDTDAAINLIHQFLAEHQPGSIQWLLDKPVSNSGRLKAKILDLAQSFPALNCIVELVPDPDPVLKEIPTAEDIAIITADSGILDHCGFWLNTAREIVAREAVPENRILVDFSES